jgi:AmmeMemoRadiSam system protein A
MLTDSDKSRLLKLARITLEAYLADGTSPACSAPSAGMLEPKGAFVSLHLGEELRGCIGQLFPDRELYRIVQYCTLSAALEDSRFLPVTRDELAELEIEISVLTPFVRVRDIEEIAVGKHGLYVVQGGFRGLLLPQVATQYRWDRITFLEQTCRKAGLPETAYQDRRTIIHTFEADVFSESTFP